MFDAVPGDLRHELRPTRLGAQDLGPAHAAHDPRRPTTNHHPPRVPLLGASCGRGAAANRAGCRSYGTVVMHTGSWRLEGCDVRVRCRPHSHSCCSHAEVQGPITPFASLPLVSPTQFKCRSSDGQFQSRLTRRAEGAGVERSVLRDGRLLASSVGSAEAGEGESGAR